MRRLLSMLMLATAAGTMIPAASAFAGEPPASRPGMQRFGVRLVDVPVSAMRNPRALRYIIDYLAPGQAIHRRILILNEESRTAHFTVYPDAARIGHGLFTGDAGETRSELTRWITLKHGSLTLRPHASALDMVTIRVPRAAIRGENYGVIWAQQVAHGRTAHGLRITEVARVGIRIYLAVGRGGAPPTRFVITSLTGHWSTGGQPLLVARVRNTGGRAIDLSGQARLCTRSKRAPPCGHSGNSRSSPSRLGRSAEHDLRPQQGHCPRARGWSGSPWPAGSPSAPPRQPSSSPPARPTPHGPTCP